MKLVLVLSCEHGGNGVPACYRPVFEGAARELASHAGWDPGAALLARELGRAFDVAPIVTTTTRLLVDTNRSEGHRAAFSRWTRSLPAAEREHILARYWRPHRAAVEEAVRAGGEHTVLHVSVHSFTPRWKGEARPVDVGLLYDPARAGERSVVDAWLRALGEVRSDLRLRRNQPYRGTSDGLTTHLRRRFAPRRYLGIELEVSQRFVLGAARPWRQLRRDLAASLRTVLLPQRPG